MDDRSHIPPSFRLINAAGTVTRLGGTLPAPEVLAAMSAAAGAFVRIDEMNAAVGRRLAELTGAEAAIVVNGAAAGLTLAAAACMAGLDAARMERLPQARGMPNRIVVPRSQRNGYDHALRAAGARLVEVGLEERTRDPQAWEIAAAIDERTAAVAYFAGFSPLDLSMVVTAAHARGVAVIVDASASLPPKANLTRFIAAGADLVVYSGGKGLRGPQASGILCGRRELIASAALQMWDLDFLPELWNPPPALIDAQVVARGVPNHGLGRAMKVGKEEIAGLAAAVERFVASDQAAENQRLAGLAAALVSELSGITGVDALLVPRAELWPLVRLGIDAARVGVSAIELARRLESGDPRVYFQTGDARRGALVADVFNVAAGEIEAIGRQFRAALGVRA